MVMHSLAQLPSAFPTHSVGQSSRKREYLHVLGGDGGVQRGRGMDDTLLCIGSYFVAFLILYWKV